MRDPSAAAIGAVTGQLGKSFETSAEGETTMPDGGDIRTAAEAADALYYAMRRARSTTMHRAGRRVTAAQSALLDPLLDDDNGIPVGRLAAAAAVSMPTATRALRQLEDRKLVERARSCSDDRVVLVRLTADGATIMGQAREDLRRRQRTTFRRFSKQERLDLTRLLSQLAGYIDEQVKGPGA